MVQMTPEVDTLPLIPLDQLNLLNQMYRDLTIGRRAMQGDELSLHMRIESAATENWVPNFIANEFDPVEGPEDVPNLTDLAYAQLKLDLRNLQTGHVQQAAQVGKRELISKIFVKKYKGQLTQYLQGLADSIGLPNTALQSAWSKQIGKDAGVDMLQRCVDAYLYKMSEYERTMGKQQGTYPLTVLTLHPAPAGNKLIT